MHPQIKYTDDRWAQYMTVNLTLGVPKETENTPTKYPQLPSNPAPAVQPNTAPAVQPNTAPAVQPNTAPAVQPNTVTRYIISGHQQDTLFWLLFVGYEHGGGVAEFERIQYNSGRTRIEIKNDVIKSTTLGIKQFKTLTGGSTLTTDQLQDRRATLQTQTPTRPNMFPLYAVHYASPIYVIDLGRHAYCMYDYVGDRSEGCTAPLPTNVPIILYKSGPRWSVELDAKAVIKTTAFDSYVHINDLERAMLSVGKYTKLELTYMIQKLIDAKKIDPSNENEKLTIAKMSKQALYDRLVAYFT